MKIKLLVTIIFFLFSASIFAQGYNSTWLLGYGGLTPTPIGGGTNLTFINDSVSVSRKIRAMSFDRTNASICDKNGNLLFYTNGFFIADATEDTMQNGAGLFMGVLQGVAEMLVLAQGAIILKNPGLDTNFYFLFHLASDTYNSCTALPTQLLKTTIDMSLNNGLGAVTSKNVPILLDTITEFGLLSACKHGNGRDWWLILPEYATNGYFKFLLTPYGIQQQATQYLGALPSGCFQGSAQSAFSPDGRKYARYDEIDDLNIYDFDRCSGNFSNPIHVAFPDTNAGGGLAFSPNSSKLYISSTEYLYQLDLNQANIAASLDTVGIYDGFFDSIPYFRTTFYTQQLAPDGKIYISNTNSTRYLHVISYPDSLGAACGLAQHGLKLKTFNGFTMPCFPNYYLDVDSGSVCDTIQTTHEFLDAQESFQIRVFPSPAKSTEQISFLFPNLLSRGGMLKIFNSQSELICTQTLAQWTSIFKLNSTLLKSGIYLVQILTGEKQGKYKFVVTD